MEDAVSRAVMQLPDTQKEVLILAHYEHLPLAEIARVMALDLGAVKSRLQRARATLQETLAAYASSLERKKMNETELDDLLDTWTAPPPPASLRQSVQAGFAAGHERTRVRAPRARKRLFAAAILCAAALLLVVAQAHPGAPVRIPYIVDSEFVRHGNDGSSSIDMYTESYELNGREILKSRSIPGGPFGTVVGRAADATLPIWYRLMARWTADAETLERLRQHASHAVGVIGGCDASCLVLERYFFARAAAGAGSACIEGAVVGHDTILNFPVTAVRPPGVRPGG